MWEITRKCGFEGIVAIAAAGLGMAQPAPAVSALAQLDRAVAFTTDAIARGYRTAPALMLGLAMLAAIPALAVAVRVRALLLRPADATRRVSRMFARQGENISGAQGTLAGKAFLEAVDADGTRFAIARDMLRIGREDDNDIRIPSAAVHRYHAAILRETFGGYRITDLSGRDGTGIVINGKRCNDACLEDGDVIELGPGRLRFHAGLM